MLIFAVVFRLCRSLFAKFASRRLCICIGICMRLYVYVQRRVCLCTCTHMYGPMHRSVCIGICTALCVGMAAPADFQLFVGRAKNCFSRPKNFSSSAENFFFYRPTRRFSPPKLKIFPTFFYCLYALPRSYGLYTDENFRSNPNFFFDLQNACRDYDERVEEL